MYVKFRQIKMKLEAESSPGCATQAAQKSEYTEQAPSHQRHKITQLKACIGIKLITTA